MKGRTVALVASGCSSDHLFCLAGNIETLVAPIAGEDHMHRELVGFRCEFLDAVDYQRSGIRFVGIRSGIGLQNKDCSRGPDHHVRPAGGSQRLESADLPDVFGSVVNSTALICEEPTSGYQATVPSSQSDTLRVPVSGQGKGAVRVMILPSNDFLGMDQKPEG